MQPDEGSRPHNLKMPLRIDLGLASQVEMRQPLVVPQLRKLQLHRAVTCAGASRFGNSSLT